MAALPAPAPPDGATQARALRTDEASAYQRVRAGRIRAEQERRSAKSARGAGMGGGIPQNPGPIAPRQTIPLPKRKPTGADQAAALRSAP